MPISGGSGGGGSGGFSSGGGMHNTGMNMHHNIYGTGNYNNRNNKGRGPKKGKGFIILICFVAYLASLVLGSSATRLSDHIDEIHYENDYTNEYVNDENYTAVIKKKNKLDESLCEKTENYLYDTYETGIIKSPKKLAKSFKNFAEKTGVEPCLYITDDPYIEDHESQAYDKYLELFNDEGHLLIYFYAETEVFEYHYELMIGTDTAKEVLDEDALYTLRSYLDSMDSYYELYDYVSDSYDYTDAFCMALTDSIDDIMTYVEYIPIESQSQLDEVTEDETEVVSVQNPIVAEDETEVVSVQNPTVTETEPTQSIDSSDDYKSSGNVSRVFVVILAAMVAVALVSLVVVISKTRNNMKLDEYHSDRTDNDYDLDDYDEQFKKRESKYDDFSRR